MTATEKIAALRATHEAATEGRWQTEPHWRDEDAVLRIATCDCNSKDTQCEHQSVVRQLGCNCCDDGLEGRAEDFAAIVSAHNALPALLKALEDVLDIERVPVNRGQVQTYDEGWLDGYNDARREFRTAIEAALAEVDHG